MWVQLNRLPVSCIRPLLCSAQFHQSIFLFFFLEASHGTCVSNVPNHSEMFDRFERKLSPLWYKITGGQVGTGCGILSDGKSLYFNGPGKREARTVPLDTTNIRSILSAASRSCLCIRVVSSLLLQVQMWEGGNCFSGNCNCTKNLKGREITFFLFIPVYYFLLLRGNT